VWIGARVCPSDHPQQRPEPLDCVNCPQSKGRWEKHTSRIHPIAKAFFESLWEFSGLGCFVASLRLISSDSIQPRSDYPQQHPGPWTV
jgi:hypothetical protein